MVTLSLRGRMVATAVAAAAIALGALLLLSAPRIERQAREEARTAMVAEARLMARVVEDALDAGGSSAAVDAVVDEASGEIRARVTVIARDGTVIGESARSGSELAEMENHASRPEVQAALAGREHFVVRRSSTLAAEQLYVAVPVRRESSVVGVVRLARRVDAITAEARGLWWSAALALAAGVAVTGLLSLWLSRPLAASLGRIMDAARRLAAGDLSARIAAGREDELGELARLVNSSADELQQRLGELARDRARTHAILAALDDGVLAVDHQGTVVLANARLSEAMGLEAPIGRHYLEVVRQQEVEQIIEDVLRGGERCDGEFEVVRTRRTFTVSAVAFPGAEGAPHGVVLTFNDATERHRVDRIRRDFVANASHELRTPLTSIRGFVEALEDGAIEEPENARRFLAKIRAHSERMTALVSDLLELSRLETGDRPPQWASVRVQGVVERVVDLFEDLAERRGVALSGADAGAPAVTTDPERVQRILENLVDNAVKYTAEGGHVRVSAAAAEGGGVRLEVADDGPGIAPEHLERIFERFYRVDKARSRELGGTGLGLSIVKHLADGMGASVSVSSEPGRGSRFVVLLPAAPAAEGPREA